MRNVYSTEPLKVEQILAWADAHHAATGRWPNAQSGPVDPVSGETWDAINDALRAGSRGLGGVTSLARLLSEHRGAKTRKRPRALTVEQILAWADAHYAATGRWPTASTGAVAGVPGETWDKIQQALYNGHRGLPGDSSLARLLAQCRGHRNRGALSKLNHDQILAWADALYAAQGRWPRVDSGPVTAAPGETWNEISTALKHGLRGLSGGSSLFRLLASRRPVEQP